MPESAREGEWVEIGTVLLQPGERAPQVPEDTARTALEMRCKGFLVRTAAIGQKAEVVTATGRHVVGELLRINPAYDHGFGDPVSALLSIGAELRRLLDESESPS